MEHFISIVSKPDNIPIVGMVLLIGFYTWLGLREARKNDRLIEEGKDPEVLKRMQK